MLIDLTLRDYLDQLASAAPTPGGGAAAALTGAQGAALVSMVCNLTIGKKKYADVEEEMKQVLAQSETLRAKLTELIDKDAAAFDKVSEAYGMPKSTDEEKAARRAAIQEALKGAEAVPMETMEACLEVIRLAIVAAQKGNKNVVSDAAVGGILAHAGLLSAADNVKINLNLIKDETFVEREQAKLDALLDEAKKAMEALEDALQGKL
ncbi:MAG: cyclodeaminase/cyclohydrolase family protein [Chloroflexi bacterium]|nr:cyclodeaminase/cyclohydrolase family protein [Chloroflexota bacterium]